MANATSDLFETQNHFADLWLAADGSGTVAVVQTVDELRQGIDRLSGETDILVTGDMTLAGKIRHALIDT